jgi:hypothetical protein
MRAVVLIILSAILLAPDRVGAQQPRPAEPTRETQLPEAPQAAKQPPAPPAGQHRFWDKQNAWLFAGVAASRALDFHSTGNMRRRGNNEILLTNAVVDNKPAFAAIEAAAAATSVGLSYLLHRKNHHKLERWVSRVHIGVATFGAVRNYCLKSRR